MSEIKRVLSIGDYLLDAVILGNTIMMKYAKREAHYIYIHVVKGS